MVTILVASVKLLFGILEFFSMFMLSFALFRIPIRYNELKMILVAVLVELISLYQREYLGMGASAVPVMIAAYILLVSLLFNIQLLFSAIICVFGYLSFAAIQSLLAYAAIFFGLTTTESIAQSLVHGSILQVASASAVFALVYWMMRRKLGFMFIQKRITFHSGTRAHNIFLLCFLLLAIAIMQLTIISFQENANIIYVLGALILVSIAGFAVTYSKNKKEINEKYDRLSKKGRI